MIFREITTASLSAKEHPWDASGARGSQLETWPTARRSESSCAALMISAAFSAMPYTALLGCALSCMGMTDASTTRRFVVAYTFRCASTTPRTITMSIFNYLAKPDAPPRLRRIMAAVPTGCATDSKPSSPGWTIHFFQSASEPPSPLFGTVASPGKISLVDSELWFDVSKQHEGRLWDDKVQEI